MSSRDWKSGSGSSWNEKPSWKDSGRDGGRDSSARGGGRDADRGRGSGRERSRSRRRSRSARGGASSPKRKSKWGADESLAIVPVNNNPRKGDVLDMNEYWARADPSKVSSQSLLVDARQAMALIGNKGDKVRKMRLETNAQIEISPMQPGLFNGDWKLLIIGDVNRVIMKCQELLVYANMPSLKGVEHPPGSIHISNEMGRMFVGPGGTIINEFRKKWLRDDVRLNVLQPSLEGQSSAIFCVGPHDGVQEAKLLVMSKLHELSRHAGSNHIISQPESNALLWSSSD